MDPDDPNRRILPVASIDIRGVAEALDDADDMSSWWYDPATGQVEIGVSEWLEDELGDGDDGDPSERGLVRIEFAGSRAAYAVMVDFAAEVAEHRAGDLLQRALQGRGAFGRFRDTLVDFPELREQWLSFSRASAESRAIEWLLVEGYVDDADGEGACAERSATITEVLDVIGRSDDLRLDAAVVPDRWVEIEQAIDAGRAVMVLRTGEPWATIAPA